MTESQLQYQRELTSYLAGFLTPHKRELLPHLLMHRTRHLTVVIEDIHHSHNASACLRSCDCFGVQDVHIIENRNEYDVNHAVALGASQWLTIEKFNDPEADNTTTCLNELKSRGYSIVMTSPHQFDTELETYDISQKTALVFGNEKDGASATVRQLSDHVLRIPMFGFTESFNISVAVAVALHHLVWRLKQLDISWQLQPEERDELLRQWVRIASGRKLRQLQQRFRDAVWNPDEPVDESQLWPDWSTVLVDPHPERKHRS